MRLDRGEKQVQYLLENSSDQAIPVLISAHHRIQKEDGQEEIPQAKELTIFPPQVIVPPNQKRSIRIQWTGEAPKKELPFRIIAEQVPLDVGDESDRVQGIKMLLRYKAALYVNPGNTSPLLEVETFKINGEQIHLTLKNNGSAHQLLNNPRIQFTHQKKSYVLDANALENLDGQNVLAGTKRTFHIPKTIEIDENFTAQIRVE